MSAALPPCGLTQQKLDEKNWIDTDGCCSAKYGPKRSDGTYAVCSEPYANHFSSTAAASSSSSAASRKRKSLPPPASGGEWTTRYLEAWSIEFVDVSDIKEFLCRDALPVLSDRTRQLTEDCKVIDGNTIVSPSAFPSLMPSEASHHLLKLMHLVAGNPRVHLESFVDDFILALLGYLGFNSGDMVVTSKNRLRLKMSPADNGRECATADVTVLNIRSLLRLAVWEDKIGDDALTLTKIKNTEAQGVAEIIAACQWNMENRSQRPRSAPPSSISSSRSSSSVIEPPAPPSSSSFQRMFLIRVWGDRFVFYHANTVPVSLLEAIENRQPHEQTTRILRFQPIKISKDEMELELSRELEVALRFRVPTERQIIFQLLDAILQALQ